MLDNMIQQSPELPPEPHDLHAELRQRVGPLTLQLPSKDVVGLGTCFVIGAMGGLAIAVTAAHCLHEAEKHDVLSRVPSAPGSPFQVERPNRTWNKIALGAVIRHRELPFFMSLPLDVEEAYAHELSDIAFLLVKPDQTYSHVQLDRAIGISSNGPVTGEKVLVVGFFETEVDASHHVALDGRAALTSVTGKFQVVTAEVTGVFPDGVRDMKWPCFQLNCPFYSGMSGGCVMVERAGRLWAAGVVSRDISYEASASGDQAFAAHLGHALDIGFPVKDYQRLGEGQSVQVKSIRDLVTVGVIEDLDHP